MDSQWLTDSQLAISSGNCSSLLPDVDDDDDDNDKNTGL